MVPEEWPIAAPAADRMVAPARNAGRDRLSTVRLDFFLDADQRLNEQERAVMTAMLHGLVSDIADEIRAALPARSAVANDEDNSELIADLRASACSTPCDRSLLRRADDEHTTAVKRVMLGETGGSCRLWSATKTPRFRPPQWR